MFQIIMKPNGDLVDFHAWDEFAETLARVVELGGEEVVLDMINVQRMSSNYIGSTISSFKNAQERDKKLSLVNVQPKLYDLLEMLKLTDVMPVERI